MLELRFYSYRHGKRASARVPFRTFTLNKKQKARLQRELMEDIEQCRITDLDGKVYTSNGLKIVEVM